MPKREMERLLDANKHLSGLMPYFRSFAQEQKEGKRKPFRSAKELTDAVLAAQEKDDAAVAQWLKSPENKLLSGAAKKGLGKPEMESLIREVGAGPATLSLLQELNNNGKPVDELEDLIPLLKAKNAANAKDPVVARALAGANQSPAELDRSRDRELLQQHLAEGHLLDKAPVPKDPELDRLLADGKGIHPTKDLCDYLSDVDKEYPSTGDLEKKGIS